MMNLSPGELRRIPNTALREARQADGSRVIEWLSDPVTGADQPWPSDAGEFNERSIMLAESGAGIDLAKKEIYVCGGGHGDGAHFGVYGLNLETWKWCRAIRHPQLFNGQQNWPPLSTPVGTTTNPDGSPVSRHTWGGIFFWPERSRLVIALGSTWPTGWTDPERLSWLGDCQAGTWTKGHQLAKSSNAAMIGAVFYPPNKLLWVSDHVIREHNLDTGENKVLNGRESFPGVKAQLILDVSNQLLYVTSAYSQSWLRVFDLTKPGSTTKLLTPSGDLTALYTQRTGQWYSPRYGLVQWCGGNEIYVAKLPDTEFKRYTLIGDAGPQMVKQGMFGKFSPITEDGEYFIILTEVMNDAYVGRMPSMGGIVQPIGDRTMRFVPVSPQSSEQGSYDRRPFLFIWYKPGPIQWTWAFDSSASFTTWPRARMVVYKDPGDPVLVTEWAPPVGRPNSNGVLVPNWYTFDFDLPDAHYLAKPEIEGMPTLDIMAKPFIVNRSGQPLPEQKPWVSTVYFEQVYGNHGVYQAQVPYNSRVPKQYPLKPRVIEPYSERLTQKQLWSYCVHPNTSARLTRMFAQTQTGDVAIEDTQKYFYGDAIAANQFEPVVEPPSVHLRDGPPGVGTIGYTYKTIVRRGLKGFFHSDTSGSLRFEQPSGNLITLAGWREKPDELPPHGGMLSSFSPYLGQEKADHVAFFRSKWELVGDWSRVNGPAGFLEPWGHCVALRREDGSIDKRDGAEGWVCDTLHHRVVYWNHWTAHPFFYQKAHFPPDGYVAPDAPTGQTQLVSWVETTDGKPDQYLNEPWDCDFLVTDEERIYWTNFAGNSIASAKGDGTDKQVLVESSIHPSEADLFLDPAKVNGITRYYRLSLINNTELEANRARFLIDGPFGVASLVRPQAMGFNSQGKLIVVERYTGAIREIDLQARYIRTLALLPKYATGSSSASTRDFSMCIDVEGTCGPKDDIFIQGWHQSDFRFSADGTYLGKFIWTSGGDLPNGPLNTVNAPGYAWGIGVGDGLIRVSGNAAGWQDIYVVPKLPTDPVLDRVTWERGMNAYQSSPMFLTHGPHGDSRLGFPSFYELGALSDGDLDTYLLEQGIAESEVPAARYYVRWTCIDRDYTEADTTAPDTMVLNVQRVDQYDRSAVVEFSSDDPAATFEARVDGSPWAAATSPLALSDLAIGDHVVQIRAKDQAGNIDPTPAEAIWTVHEQLPEPTCEEQLAAAEARSAQLAEQVEAQQQAILEMQGRIDAAVQTLTNQ